MIKNYRITKLFGFRTVSIPFEDNIKILIGENGLGKTTILNSLYYVLTGKYKKLCSIEFERIDLMFKDNQRIQFTKRELEAYLNFESVQKRIHMPARTMQLLDLGELEELINTNLEEGRNIDRVILQYMQENNIPRWAPSHIMLRELKALIRRPNVKKFVKFEGLIKSYNINILYFPTYRRVEEDLKNLGRIRRKTSSSDLHEIYIPDFEDDFNVSEDTLIHFGMEDVVQRISQVKNFISNSTVDGFSKVTGEILSQLLRGFPDIEQEKIETLDVGTARIVLHRVGDSLSKTDRKRILNLLDDPKKLGRKKELTYFLLNLIEIYNRHKHVDDAIKKFRDVCNEYLEDKEFRYNESSVEIEVYRKNTDETVSLDKLSSGEKQIISLFSRVYLELTKNYIVLFDEPELSLSINWQKLLLPDIVASEKCNFLLSVTHSPFIFKNELDKYAVGMKAYIQ